MLRYYPLKEKENITGRRSQVRDLNSGEKFKTSTLGEIVSLEKSNKNVIGLRIITSYQSNVISFRIVHRLTSIVNRIEVFLMSFPQDRTYGEIACIAHKLKWQVPVWGNQDWSFRKFFLQCLESLDTIFGENERSILLEKMSHRSGDFGEILNESLVKIGVTEETSNTLDGCGMRQFSNDIEFGTVDLNPVFRNLMAEDNALFDHKVAFLPV
nr:hypothetical protein [Tanacetum cinerariifolium]